MSDCFCGNVELVLFLFFVAAAALLCICNGFGSIHAKHGYDCLSQTALPSLMARRVGLPTQPRPHIRTDSARTIFARE